MLHRRATLALLALVAAAAVVGVRDAGASTSIAIPFESLVQRSTAAVIGTPLTQTSTMEDGRIVTYSDVHIDTSVAGDPPTDDVWIRTLGGTLGHIGQTVEGEAELTVGHPCLLFLRPAVTLHSATPGDAPVPLPGVWSVTERAQGQFPVVRHADGVLRLVRSFGVDGALPPFGRPQALLAMDALHDVKVADATALVSKTWSQVHAP
jgi:hypothetical protein